MVKRYFTLLLLFSVLINPVRGWAQEEKETIIDEYFFGTTLQEVITILEEKYNVQIDYKTEEIEGLAFDHLLDGYTPTEVFETIVREVPRLSYYQDEYSVFHLGLRKNMVKQTEISNTRYKGNSKQTDIRVSGIIKDAKSNESVPFATVVVVGTINGATSNEDGYFTLFHVPSDTSTLEVSSVGYKNTRLFLSPEMDLTNVLMKAEPSSIDLREVEVVAERDELMRVSEKVSVVTMSPRKIATLPNAGERDIFRSFQLLPGISGSNEGSSGLYVRGGTPDQNLILYDGFTVYHVDHLFGMFSAFNSNAVKEVELYKGGFEARFGGRISSVVNIVGKDGNEKAFNVGGDLSLLSANIYLEVPVKDKLTILFAARRSWQSPLYQSIFSSFSDVEDTETERPQGGPPGGGGGGGRGGVQREEAEPTSYFYDLNAKVSYKPTDKDILSASFFNGEDKIDNSRETELPNSDETSETVDLTRWGNWGSSINWSRKWNSVFYTYALASVSNYYSERTRTRSNTLTDDNDEVVEVVRGTNEENQLYDYTAKWEGELKLSKSHQLEFGWQSSFYDINYDFTLNDSINIQNRTDQGAQHSIYLQDNWSIMKRFTFIPGLRTSYFDVTDVVYYEPRASLSFKLNKHITLKSAWGHYYQTVNRIVRNDLSSGSRDFWVLSDDETVPVGFAEHFVLGAEYETPNYIFNIEAYRKNMTGLSEYSLQFTPQFANVDFDEFFFEGTGYSQGVEFLLQKKYGDFTGWAGYTLGEVIYDFDAFGGPFYATQDVTHEFKIVQSYALKNWTFAATWILASGKPYTSASGSYEVEMVDGTTETFINLDAKNSSRYPAYHRLDVAVTREFTFGDQSSGSIGFSVFNLYNRKNIWYREFEVDDDDLIVTDVTLLGFTPNLTLSLRLR